MHVLEDLRYAIRTLRSHPGSTLVIVASLAIGIGANTAIFSVVNALLLKPLPYPDPERLAALWLRSPGINIPQDWPSPGQYIDIQQENRSFEAMSISRGRSGTLIRGDRPERVQVLRDLVEPVSDARRDGRCTGGCSFPRRTCPGKPPIVVLSHGFWKRDVRRRSERRRQEHHVERRRAGAATRRTSSRSSACSVPTSC